MNDKPCSPIFIVGASRSGTTLLAAMFAAHSRLCCGTETRFFQTIDLGDVAALTHPGHWPERAVEFLYSVKEERIPIPDNYGVSAEHLRECLSAVPPSVAAMLNAVMEPFARRLGKARWVEKTPGHLLYPDLIRRYFPESPIIHIVRDPRDVAVSNAKVRSAAFVRTYFGALFMWRYFEANGSEFLSRDPLNITVSYEDLLRQPERELRRLCEFIGEDFEASMLNPASGYAAVNSIDEPWKRKVSEPLDPSRAHGWRKELGEEELRQAECVAGDLMEAYGYERTHRLERYGRVFPLERLLIYPEAVRWLTARGIRLWPSRAGERPEVLLYVGRPKGDFWLESDRPAGRIREALALLREILGGKLAGRRIHWLAKADGRPQSGVLNLLLELSLKAVGHSENLAQSDPSLMTWRNRYRRVSAKPAVFDRRS